MPLLLLAVLTFFGGLGRGAIADSDEAFYAESAREMVESGDWLTPHFNYEQRFQKPVLYYWLTAILYLGTGPTEIAARFWAALSGVGLVLITAACARRWFDEDTALLAGAIAATSFGYFALARMALPDLPLAFLITLAIAATFAATLERSREPRWILLVAAAAAALGFLTKGPLALVLPALVIVPVLLIERRSFDLDLTGAPYGGSGACNPRALIQAAPTLLGGFAANLTIVSPAVAPGFAAIKPRQNSPVSSLINWYEAGAGVQAANAGIFTTDYLALGTPFVIQTSAPTHALLDLLGFFVPPEVTPLQTTFVSASTVTASGGNGLVETPACPAGFSLTGGGCSTDHPSHLLWQSRQFCRGQALPAATGTPATVTRCTIPSSRT